MEYNAGRGPLHPPRKCDWLRLLLPSLSTRWSQVPLNSTLRELEAVSAIILSHLLTFWMKYARSSDFSKVTSSWGQGSLRVLATWLPGQCSFHHAMTPLRVEDKIFPFGLTNNLANQCCNLVLRLTITPKSPE